MNYSEALKRMKGRRDPEAVILFEKYGSLKEEDPVRYLVGAMSEIPARYTQKTFEEAERVQNQILKGLARHELGADFRYQGSVTKNTHIIAYSDIDVLSIEERFTTLESPQSARYPYQGDPVRDLCEMREIIEDCLSRAFPEANVDSSKAKCINISGGSLCRAIDIVPSNWWDTNDFAETNNEIFRGVHVLDFHRKVREADTPFIHAALFIQRDEEFGGNLRQLVRLCKSLKHDSGKEEVMPSSYDIEALVYAMSDNLLRWAKGQEIQLASACGYWLRQIEDDPVLRSRLEVPDGKRKIFALGKTTLSQLIAIRRELDDLLGEVYAGLKRQSREISEARINHLVASF